MSNIRYFLKQHLKEIAIILLLVVVIALGLYIFVLSFSKEETISEVAIVEEPKEVEEVEESLEEKLINIDVKGAVKKPGVYQVSPSAIVNDVITLAGGFNSNAYKNGINLSKKVVDEMVIYVYTKSEITAKTQEVPATTTCQEATYDICECVEEQKSIITVDPSSTTDEVNTKDENPTNTTTSLVNINSASLSELTTLSGIGEAKAEAIIAYRSENGSFKTIEEIQNVSGIGQALFEKIKDNITV